MFGHAFWVVSPHKVEQNTPQHSPTLCQNLMLLQRKRKLSLRRVQMREYHPDLGMLFIKSILFHLNHQQPTFLL